ncbi:MAG: hypothetical protein GXO00_02390 [Candidatus Diapherotrites archaeon]|nr:hypothetical protein [Candidatus Diapherotrites archaeon]
MKGQQAIGTLVIFIALVITAALASFVLVSTTNALQSKSLAVANKTMEKSTYGFSARTVEGLTTVDDGNVEYVMFSIELAPGSGTIDLYDVTTIWQAAGGTVYGEYKYNDDNVELNTAALATTTPFLVNGTAAALADGNFYVVINRSQAAEATPDRYVEAGELYTIAISLPQALNEGEDWTIILRAPYTQDLVITGYAPEVLQAGQIVLLK